MMKEDSVTESETSSSESSSGYDWHENERKKRHQGRKSKMTKRKYSSHSLEKLLEKKSHLPVTCGHKGGYLYLQKLSNNEKCILSEGQWFNPSEFEKFGGKEKSKKWKNSIYYLDVPLQKLIEDECISCPVLKKSRNHHEESESRESSPVAGRRRKTKARRKLPPSDSESEYSVHNENNHNNNSNEDIIDITDVQDPTLPVTSSSLTGHVHKNRFTKDQKLIIPSVMEDAKATETKQALISGPTSNPKIPQPDTLCTTSTSTRSPVNQPSPTPSTSQCNTTTSRPPVPPNPSVSAPVSATLQASEDIQRSSTSIQSDSHESQQEIELFGSGIGTAPPTIFLEETSSQNKTTTSQEQQPPPPQDQPAEDKQPGTSATNLTNRQERQTQSSQSLEAHKAHAVKRTAVLKTMRRVLEPDAVSCDCDVCQELNQTNDDDCYICDSDEEVVCCDECPRAFHPHCHLPAAVDIDSGSQWTCTFCVMRKMEESNQRTRQEVLNSPLFHYKLHCQ